MIPYFIDSALTDLNKRLLRELSKGKDYPIPTAYKEIMDQDRKYKKYKKLKEAKFNKLKGGSKNTMEIKSRYEIIAELEEKKRTLIMERDGMDKILKQMKKDLRDSKREIEDEEESIKDYEEKMEDNKKTIQELIKSTDESLKRLSEIKK